MGDCEESPFRNLHPKNCWRKRRKLSSLEMLASTTKPELWMNVIMFCLKPLSNKTFSVSAYLTKLGLHASRVRFYLLTSKCLHSDDGESLENAIGESQPEMGQMIVHHAFLLAISAQVVISARKHNSRSNTKLQQEPSLYIDGVRKSMNVEFNREKALRLYK